MCGDPQDLPDSPQVVRPAPPTSSSLLDFSFRPWNAPSSQPVQFYPSGTFLRTPLSHSKGDHPAQASSNFLVPFMAPARFYVLVFNVGLPSGLKTGAQGA